MTTDTAVLTPVRAGGRRLHVTPARVALVVGLALPFGFARVFGEYGNTIVVNAAIAMLAVAGLHMLVHWAGQISIAQVAFMGVGAFVTTRANTALHVPLLVAILCGVAAAVVASLAIGLPALRIRGLALAITTLAFSFAASQWLFLQPWLVPQVSGVALEDQSLLGFDITQSRELVIPVGIVTVAVLALTSVIGTSALGRSLRMVAHDEEVAFSYGISVAAQKLIAFLYAGGCAGLAGAFTTLSIGRVGPPAFPVGRSIVFLSSVLLGGPGAIWGSMQAAAGLAVIPFVAVGLGQYVDLLGALGILAVVVVSPAGLNGLSHQLQHLIGSRLNEHKEGKA